MKNCKHNKWIFMLKNTLFFLFWFCHCSSTFFFFCFGESINIMWKCIECQHKYIKVLFFLYCDYLTFLGWVYVFTFTFFVSLCWQDNKTLCKPCVWLFYCMKGWIKIVYFSNAFQRPYRVNVCKIICYIDYDNIIEIMYNDVIHMSRWF